MDEAKGRKRTTRIMLLPEMAGIGGRMRDARERVGLSQRKVMAGTGFTPAYLSRIESGDRFPSRDFLDVVAPRISASVAWLETGRDLVEIRVERETLVKAIPTLHGDLLDAAIAAAFPGRAALEIAFAVALAEIANDPGPTPDRPNPIV